VSARKIAGKVLVRVWQDEAFAAAALSTELDKARVDQRDKALATTLTYGVLRTQPYLQRRLQAFGRLKLSDNSLLSELLMAAYQIEFLDRVPDFAAIHEAVETINSLRGPRVGGFVNAILRRLAGNVSERRTLSDATLESAPSWLKKRLIRDLGPEEGLRILHPEQVPGLTLRLREGTSVPEFLKRGAEACPYVPGAFRYTGGGDPRGRDEYRSGQFVIQELGAQLVAHALGVRRGETVLDVCAGRGQKTSLLAEHAGPTSRILATDLHGHKIEALKAEMERTRTQVEAEVWDWTQTPPDKWVGAFDRVLVDAPCSGVGTIARRPEIARRLNPEDPGRLAQLQRTIALHAARCLRPGGVLAFATCSVLREEGEEVTEALCAEGGLEPVLPETMVDSALFPPPSAPQANFRLLPHSHGTDGYFVARLQRK